MQSRVNCDFLKPREGKGKEKETDGDEGEADEKQDAEGVVQNKELETPNGDAKQRAMSHDTGGELSSRSGKLQFKGPGTMSLAQSMPHRKRSNSRNLFFVQQSTRLYLVGISLVMQIHKCRDCCSC